MMMDDERYCTGPRSFARYSKVRCLLPSWRFGALWLLLPFEWPILLRTKKKKNSCEGPTRNSHCLRHRLSSSSSSVGEGAARQTKNVERRARRIRAEHL